jgi:hypothetical protein
MNVLRAVKHVNLWMQAATYLTAAMLEWIPGSPKKNKTLLQGMNKHLN